MINKKTVFVLGAGASCPYGYPSGPELVRRVVQTCRSPQPDGALGGLAFDAATCIGFADLLHKAKPRSIDLFLEPIPIG